MTIPNEDTEGIWEVSGGDEPEYLRDAAGAVPGFDPSLLRDILQEALTQQLLPFVLHTQQESLQAGLQQIREEFRQAQPPSIQALAQEVTKLVAPELSQQVQPLGDAVRSLLEWKQSVSMTPAPSTSPAQTQAQTQSNTPPVQNPAEQTRADKLATIGAVIDTVVGVITDKLLPAWATFQQTSAMSKRQGAYDVQWASALRQQDPLTATIIANVLNPDPLAAQLPLLLAANAQQVGSGAYLRGLQTRMAAQKILTDTGGAPSLPITPSSLLPGSSGSPPMPVLSKGGVSMSGMSGNGHSPQSPVRTLTALLSAYASQ